MANYMAEITPKQMEQLKAHLDDEGRKIFDKCVLRYCETPLWFWEYQREETYRKAVDEVYGAETLGEVLKLGFNNTFVSGVECGGSVGWLGENGELDNGIDDSGIPEEVLNIKVEDVLVEESEDYYTEVVVFVDDEGEKIFTDWKKKLEDKYSDWEKWKERGKILNRDYKKYAGR